ncbi:MAG: bifunctional acetate--CoA ligase family protein/GNAT family N-acetyltransferase [Anaerolineae bacterium]
MDMDKITHDVAHDVLRYERKPLDVIFKPKSVALVGATEKTGTVGRTILWNLMSSPFGGTVYPINPNRPSVLGIKAYSSVSAVPEPVDLAVICTPATTIPAIIAECVDREIKGAVIISAGFKEVGPAGVELERQILEHARRGKMRVVGPNCLGVMSPISGLNATFASAMAEQGSVGFISQSGALCTAVLDWSLKEHVGFSAFVSMGSMLDIGWGDLIYYLGDDPKTKSIVIYMETIGDARSFMSAAREVSRTKPIIVIKPGRTAAAAKAAASHTGSLTGSDDVLDAAFRRSGVLRVNDISDLFHMAEVLAKQPRPRGPRLTIVTNAGGPGVLATDALITGGGELSDITEETMNHLNQFLPAVWSHNNPIDVIGDASPERYAKTLEVCVKDPNSDGLLVILTPQAMTEPTRTAELLRDATKEGFHKPVIASWMGGDDVARGEQVLNEANIPTFPYPDTAAQMYNYMWRYTQNQRGLYETPSLAEAGENGTDRTAADKIIAEVRKGGRTILTEFESKQLLAAYGIPIVQTIIATSPEDACKFAEQIGYPVVLKLYSETITHKTDVGGVQLNLTDADDVRRAYESIKASVTEKKGAEHFQGVTVQPMIKLEGYELILGSSIDLQFGPVLLFGMGGQLVEVFKDRSLGLPPLNTTLARRMMERTKIYAALKGVRGRKPVDLAALEQLLVRFSQLVAEQRWIKEIDINPLLASPERLLALDARVVIHDSEVTEEQLPRLAIRPYPRRYVQPWTMRSGETATIRPIRPEDEPMLVKFHEKLSAHTVYLRYFQTLELSRRIEHERLARICFIDYDREMALVAERINPESKEQEVVGVGRLSKVHGQNEAEYAILVSDEFQGSGLGTELLSRLIQVAREEKVGRVVAYMLTENVGMRRVSEKLGFKMHYDEKEQLVKAELDLTASEANPVEAQAVPAH